jgi:hypothetical protein
MPRIDDRIDDLNLLPDSRRRRSNAAVSQRSATARVAKKFFLND